MLKRLVRDSQSSEEDTRASIPLSQLLHPAHVWTLSHDRINMPQLHYTTILQWYQDLIATRKADRLFKEGVMAPPGEASSSSNQPKPVEGKD
ncbi:hypothetical protein TNCV_3635771 [Trichonephila clavipes]|nr:hypothetical protein TNCV_3635771 [Trichonephila clavipes]